MGLWENFRYSSTTRISHQEGKPLLQLYQWVKPRSVRRSMIITNLGSFFIMRNIVVFITYFSLYIVEKKCSQINFFFFVRAKFCLILIPKWAHPPPCCNPCNTCCYPKKCVFPPPTHTHTHKKSPNSFIFMQFLAIFGNSFLFVQFSADFGRSVPPPPRSRPWSFRRGGGGVKMKVLRFQIIFSF